MRAPSSADPFAPFRPVTLDALKGFQARRLDALAWITARLPGNRRSEKAAFNLPELGDYADKARTLAHALDEFTTIERHVELGDWKAVHHAPPEHRVLTGETLLVRYHSADQEAETAQWAESDAAGRKECGSAFAWKPPASTATWRRPSRFATFRPDDWLVLYPRWTCDERLPEEDRVFFTPTPRQMLYGQRVVLNRIVVDRTDEHGRAASGHVDVSPSCGSPRPAGLRFQRHAEGVMDGDLYTLDPCPNDWYGSFCATSSSSCASPWNAETTGLNVLYHRIAQPGSQARMFRSRGR